MTRDRGSAATEMVLLTPVLILLLLLVVHAGRAGGAASMVGHAADQGARAAAMAAAPRMESAARAAVQADLESESASGGGSCRDIGVDVRYHPGRPGSVTVTVSCEISSTGTSLLVNGGRRVEASSTEVVDVYRGGD